MTPSPVLVVFAAMNEFTVKLSDDEIEALKASKINTLLPYDGTIETAILHGIVKQIMDQENE